jgi:hypothetical protein
VSEEGSDGGRRLVRKVGTQRTAERKGAVVALITRYTEL